MAKQTAGICELCGRSDVQLTEHHLTPKEEGGMFLPTERCSVFLAINRFMPYIAIKSLPFA